MTARPCPICSRAPSEPAHAPFCSRRCADIDLQRWFAGTYAVAAVETDEDAAGGEAGRGGTDLL